MTFQGKGRAAGGSRGLGPFPEAAMGAANFHDRFMPMAAGAASGI